MSGQWSGGVANRHWQRPGSRIREMAGDTERGARIYAELRDEPFWCDNCGGHHPLREHRECRRTHPFRSAVK